MEKTSETALPGQAPGCPVLTHETVCVQADVTVTPAVDTGEIETYCVGGPSVHGCGGAISPDGSCHFTVSQRICVQIPLTFRASAVAAPSGVVCGSAGEGGCASGSCTRTIGYYANHINETNALILAAGGSVALGSAGVGASYVVTEANAGAVLAKNTPSPPAPSSPPFANQYQVLYAQLLAANLNLLSGAACMAAVSAVADANAFLETSESGVGKAGAPLVQEPLAAYNEGSLAGCPGHCGEDSRLAARGHTMEQPKGKV